MQNVCLNSGSRHTGNKDDVTDWAVEKRLKVIYGSDCEFFNAKQDFVCQNGLNYEIESSEEPRMNSSSLGSVDGVNTRRLVTSRDPVTSVFSTVLHLSALTSHRFHHHKIRNRGRC
ncbi:hypothetical protein JOB18_037372 [Solea senegalensis]|uniref:Uncharacterized protein n=1 Tax=Solea senegalensis TaxID=28829 RepID=A0AAV6PYY7_SOLSE|nr:hypothetical protein JOB18_037372 [Solea senegalensis]